MSVMNIYPPFPLSFFYFLFNLKIKHFPSVLVPHDTILNCSFLQELIQNAEDANARRVKFLHDKNSYGTEHLFDEELAQFQVKQCHRP